MPIFRSERERQAYQLGFADGYEYHGRSFNPQDFPIGSPVRKIPAKTKSRKLSAWNKFVKANSKKKEFRYANGKLKLKKMGIAFRRKRR